MWLCTFGSNLMLPIKGGLYVPRERGEIEVVSICFYQNDKNKGVINDLVRTGRTLNVKMTADMLAPGSAPSGYYSQFTAKIGANELTHLKNVSQKLNIVEGSYEWFVNLNKISSIITIRDVKTVAYRTISKDDKDTKEQLREGVKKILVEQYPYPLKEEFMEELTDLLTDMSGLGKKCCRQLVPFHEEKDKQEEIKEGRAKEISFLFSFDKEIALKAIPLAYGMSKFKKRFGRIPQIKELCMMIDPDKFNVKTFQDFVATVAGSKENFMNCLSSEQKYRYVYLYEMFSSKFVEVKTALFAKNINVEDLYLKEAAIEMFKSGKNIQIDLIIKGLKSLIDFLKSEGRERQLLAGILAYLEIVSKLDNLVELAGKPAELAVAIQTSKYECLPGGEEMAAACARLLMPQREFDMYQKLYIDSAKNALKAARTIPTISGEIEGSRYSWAFVTAEDPRGYLAGLETNCCQHLSGAGGSCVRFMAEHPEISGIFLVLKNGETVAQSFVWHHVEGGTICFDNIEALGGDIRDNVWSCYDAFADELEKRAPMFGYKRLTIGTGYSDVNLDHLQNCPTREFFTLETIPGGEDIYSDADNVQKLFRRF